MKPEEIEPYWTKEAIAHLKGRTVREVRYLTERERREMAWRQRAVVIIFDDRSQILASTDNAANDAGSLLGQTRDGEEYQLPAI